MCVRITSQPMWCCETPLKIHRIFDQNYRIKLNCERSTNWTLILCLVFLVFFHCFSHKNVSSSTKTCDIHTHISGIVFFSNFCLKTTQRHIAKILWYQNNAAREYKTQHKCHNWMIMKCLLLGENLRKYARNNELFGLIIRILIVLFSLSNGQKKIISYFTHWRRTHIHKHTERYGINCFCFCW